jgi:hypothetical protein
MNNSKMNNKCEYIDQTNLDGCNGCSRYGNYCYKHRRNYLIDENNLIIKDKFTNKISDYLVKDLEYFYIHILDCNYKKKSLSKKELFDLLSIKLKSVERFKSEESKIIIIQRSIKKFLINLRLRCNNNEDFYTFEELNKIEPNYFFSFKDKNNLYWGFDIRSLKKLFEMNLTTNPYTREKLFNNIIIKIKDRINNLKEKKIYKDIVNTDFKDRKSSIKQKTVDLISDIELNGYTIQIDWFLKLNGRRLKELYRQLEDLWNYRLSNFRETKILLSPPDGLLFTTPVNDVMDYNSVEDLQELILNNINKFKNIENPADKRLGYMYFILCLSYVSYPCQVTHSDWISFAIP